MYPVSLFVGFVAGICVAVAAMPWLMQRLQDSPAVEDVAVEISDAPQYDGGATKSAETRVCH